MNSSVEISVDKKEFNNSSGHYDNENIFNNYEVLLDKLLEYVRKQYKEILTNIENLKGSMENLKGSMENLKKTVSSFENSFTPISKQSESFVSDLSAQFSEIEKINEKRNDKIDKYFEINSFIKENESEFYSPIKDYKVKFYKFNQLINKNFEELNKIDGKSVYCTLYLDLKILLLTIIHLIVDLKKEKIPDSERILNNGRGLG